MQGGQASTGLLSSACTLAVTGAGKALCPCCPEIVTGACDVPRAGGRGCLPRGPALQARPGVQCCCCPVVSCLSSFLCPPVPSSALSTRHPHAWNTLVSLEGAVPGQLQSYSGLVVAGGAGPELGGAGVSTLTGGGASCRALLWEGFLVAHLPVMSDFSHDEASKPSGLSLCFQKSSVKFRCAPWYVSPLIQSSPQQLLTLIGCCLIRS